MAGNLHKELPTHRQRPNNNDPEVLVVYVIYIKKWQETRSRKGNIVNVLDQLAKPRVIVRVHGKLRFHLQRKKY